MVHPAKNPSLVAFVRPVLVAIMVTAVMTTTSGAGPATAQPADNQPLMVDSTGDGPDASPTDGVCATEDGTCTLRAAIQQANANAGADRIEFNIAGDGIKRIIVGATLPSINDPTGGLTIDGYTQPGTSPNTAQHGSNAVIRIEIRASNATQRVMLIESAENTIRGLALWGGEYLVELRGEGADGNLIVGNFVGLDATGTSARTNFSAIEVNLGPDRNRIGTPALEDRNVVANYRMHGVRLNHEETSENRVQNNVIGLDPTGTRRAGGNLGIDVQWRSWGNLIGGYGPNEGNVVSGSNNGIDLSHQATGNLILGNVIGTTIDGASVTEATRNNRGIIIKDDATDNYFGRNILAVARNNYSVWHKHNYTGGNTFVDNRIGVGANGEDLGGTRNGMLLRGHDDVYYGNIFANHAGGRNLLVSDTSDTDDDNPGPKGQTANNTVRRGTYYNNRNAQPISFDTGCCPHPDRQAPVITGVGPGQVNGAFACPSCEIEVYVSGSINADGTLSPGTGTTGLTWAGTVYADESGQWSMASPSLTQGSVVAVVSNGNGADGSGEVSGFAGGFSIPETGVGLVPDPDQPITPVAPPTPDEPPLYQPERFECSFSDGALSWTDVGADAYYVFHTTNGVETYLGGHTTNTLTVPGADTYRVEHWARGAATNATCDGDGPDRPEPFTCAAQDGTLSWDDAGADEYYVFATITPDGTEIYLGGHTTNTLTVPNADTYRVEHWLTGQATNATCDGDGPDQPEPFTCSHTAGVLTWTDAGADEYYVFATITPDGTEIYLGGHTTNTLTVPNADTYRVEHWLTGQATNATCDGDGPDQPEPFTCSHTAGVLTWTDAGADEYYVFATITPDGTEIYLGGHTTNTLTVPNADTYRVEHWLTGQATNATC